MRNILPAFALLIAAPFCSRAALPLPDPDNGGIQLPSGFRALVVADNLNTGGKVGEVWRSLRFIAVAQNGDLYAKTSVDGIIALRDSTGNGRFDQKEMFGSGGGTGIALHAGWLYHSTNTAVYRYKYTPGELVPQGPPELIVGGLPDGGQHNAKSFAFDPEGRLLVEIGSPYNVYSEGDRLYGAKGKDPTDFLKTHGGFWRFDPDKQNQTQADGFHFSTGHRHSLALAWQPTAQSFFMVMMGRDNLNIIDPDDYDALDNAERVSEEMHKLTEGVNMGWPFTYYDPIKKARMVSPEFGGNNRKRADPDKYDKPVIAFPGHWAPLQMAVYTGSQFPARYRGGFFVAFHGSWNRAPLPQAGYNVSFVPVDASGSPLGSFEVFASGFPQRTSFTSTTDAKYRPGGVAVGPDGSLFISDTDKGRIWRVIYTGEGNGAQAGSAGAIDPVSENQGPLLRPPGSDVYSQYCAVCHMANGSGAGQLQPALVGNPYLKGDPKTLIGIVLRGPSAVLPPDRPKYSNVMPAFGFLNDKQVADLLTSLRGGFADGASAITPGDVAAARVPSP
jgi:glucose/arabinose dehydrogenase/mono/diheme cytochrome c family protein